MDFPVVKLALLLGSWLLVAGGEGHARVKRIIGGAHVDIERAPYMLSLRLHDQHICGAVVVDSRWSLTAAHCCVSANLSLQSGTARLDGSGGGRSHRVTQATRHQLYREDDDVYDLCALRVDPAFEYSATTAAVKLPGPERAAHARSPEASVSGWGYTEADGGSLSAGLRLLNVTRVDLKDCRYAYRNLYAIHDHNVCYGSDNWPGDACQGDSGGPLVDRDSVLVGIVSFGDECGYSRLPGVYVDVVQFRDWIRQTTGL